MVCESADDLGRGKAFGIHKALDMAGSAVGIFIAYLLIANSVGGYDYKKLFLISMLPAVLGLAVLLFVKEKKKTACSQRERFWKNIKKLNGNLKLYLLVAFIFTLGNSSNAFLLLKAKSIGFTDTNVVLLYLIYNLSAAALSIPFGRLSDKIGRKKVLVAGYLVFSAVYLGFAFASSSSVMIAMFLLYGFYTAMVTGAEEP